ncbi:MAG: hypothetical protein M3Y87_27205 [Myxococcota bacterium]|nr:hypothetical protein [Myxococcota bacterium]
MNRWLLGIAVAIGLTACDAPDATPHRATGITGAGAFDELVTEQEEERLEREGEHEEISDPHGASTDIAPVEEGLGLPAGRHEDRLQNRPAPREGR